MLTALLFVILKEYHGRIDLYHFDVYRLDMKSFCETLDYEKYFTVMALR